MKMKTTASTSTSTSASTSALLLHVITVIVIIMSAQNCPCEAFIPTKTTKSFVPQVSTTRTITKTGINTGTITGSSTSTHALPALLAKKKDKNNDDDNDNEPIVELLLKKYEDEIDEFCQSTYNFWKQTVIPPVQDYVEIRKVDTTKDASTSANTSTSTSTSANANANANANASTSTNTTKDKDIFQKLIAPPELPGLPRPVWLVILGSIPTGLIWYGYYKFSIEEELYHLELNANNGKGKVTGFGGYGTLFPFVYGILLGFPLSFLPGTPGPFLLQSASLWILASQLNLYRRVNELCMEVKDELEINDPPLYEWWALLPPPLDVVVGLRQVHFLSEYSRIVRGEDYEKDIVAETLFPFIAWKERITLKQFVRTPSKWFWFTKDMKDFEYEFLKD